MVLGGENYKSHVKDTASLPALYIPQGFYFKFYGKVSKLVTALYMVTDVMDSTEPLRLKLRSSGAEILSDVYSNSPRVESKISEILSFLNIASMVGMISEMNFKILVKEFSDLQEGLKNLRNPASRLEKEKLSLEDFLREETEEEFEERKKENNHSLGQAQKTRVGVQKGETLMKVLSDKMSDMGAGHYEAKQDFDVLKKERRYEIVTILKGHADKSATGSVGLNITEIKSLAKGVLATCGNKTLQRELTSMVKDGVLVKAGEKRWSKYSLAPQNNQ